MWIQLLAVPLHFIAQKFLGSINKNQLLSLINSSVHYTALVRGWESQRGKKEPPQNNLQQLHCWSCIIHYDSSSLAKFSTVMIICSGKQVCGHIQHCIISFALLELEPFITAVFSACLLLLCKWALSSIDTWEKPNLSSLQMLCSAKDFPKTHNHLTLLYSVSWVSSLKLPVIE